MSLMQSNNQSTANEVFGALGGAAIGAGSDLIGGAINQIFAKQNMKRQIAAQKEMTDYNTNANFNEQMKVWDETNYPAQVEMMKTAGINPALMYGKGGGGGATVGNGAVTGNISAPPTNTDGKGINMMALQGAMLAAQIENIQADTKDKLANLPGKEGIPNVQEADIRSKNATADATEQQVKFFQDNWETFTQQLQENLQKTRNDADVSSWNSTNAAYQAEMNKVREQILKEYGAADAAARLQKVQNEGTLQQLEIELRKAGMSYNDPLWSRVLVRLIGGDNVNDILDKVRNFINPFK